ncbi:MAG: 2-dehydropantoate 2-reductase [Flavihumibacter sp.]|nr:2-dehydropantoate 2-reductase [Flavihumibacter sp.]
MQQPIYIIGAGAIGKALAVFLQETGKEVQLLRGSIQDGTTSRERIKVEMADGTRHDSTITIATLDNFPVLNGIIVLATKSFGNVRLAKILKSKTGDSPIVLLQNGLGVEQPFMDEQFPAVYRCVLFVTGQLINQQTVRFKPVSACPVGIERGRMQQLTELVEQLSTPFFQFKAEENIQPIIWKKAIVNCVFNTVCPLLEVDNGIFHRSEEARQIARRIIVECTTIAITKGITLEAAEVENSLLQISRLSDGQEISTFQDIRNKRETEIETLNPAVVRIAESLGMGEQVTETRLLGDLVKLKAELNNHGFPK